MQELVNLRYKDGALRAVGEKVTSSLMQTDIAYTKIYRPFCLPDGYFIAYCHETHKLYLDPGDGNYFELEDIGTLNSFQSLAWHNNTIIVYANNTSYYLQYKPNASGISTMLVFLPELTMPSVGIGESAAQIKISFTHGLIETPDMPNQAFFDVLYAGFMKKYNEKREQGYAHGVTCFYLAFRLFDGSYVKHLGPFVWNIGINKGNPVQAKAILVESNRYNWEMSMYLGRPSITWDFQSNIAYQQYISADLLQSIDVFMTRPMPLQDIFVTDYTKWITDTQAHTYTAPALPITDVSDQANYYLVKSFAAAEITPLLTGSVISLKDNLVSTIETLPIIPIDDFSNHKLIPGAHYMYNSRLHIGNINVLAGHLQNALFNWFTNSSGNTPVTAVQGNETLRNLYHSSWQPYTGTLFDTINLYAHTELIVEGKQICVTQQLNYRVWSLTDQQTYYAVGIRPLLSYPDMRAVKITYLIRIPSIDNNYRILPMQPYYQADFRIPFYANLQKSNYNNFAYRKQPAANIDTGLFLPSWLNLPSSELEYGDMEIFSMTTAHQSNVFPNANRLQVSEVNNMFHFPSKQSYSIGNNNNTIRAMCVAQQQMSESQFGEFPMYVFTDSGIYALSYGGGAEVLYSNITKFLDDKIKPGTQPITVLESTIVFQDSYNHIKALLGRQSLVISNEMEDISGSMADKVHMLIENPVIYKITTDQSICTLHAILDNNSHNTGAFLTSAHMAYDSERNEIWFSDSSQYNYSLVYQLTEKLWRKSSETFAYFIINDQHKNLGVKIQHIASNYAYNVVDMSLESYTDYVNPFAFMLTRPFELTTHGYVKIINAIARLSARNYQEIKNDVYQQSQAHIVLLGSNSGTTWLPSSWQAELKDSFTDINLKRPVGIFKYYILAYAGRLEQLELLNVDLEFMTKYDKRLH